MRIISFNVNGIRAITGKIKSGEKKGHDGDHCLKSLIEEHQPDILCLQEVKTQDINDLTCFKPFYKNTYTNFSKQKKGYSGVALLTTFDPEWVSYGFDLFHENRIGEYEKFDFEQEGRLICAKFSDCFVVTVYVPNSKPGLVRIQERIIWDTLLRNYLKELEVEFKLPVILCGDLNVAPEDKDIHKKQPKGTPGASKEERDQFKKFMDIGFIDSYRHLHPNDIKYTYWSNFANSREKNKGWRIDLFMVSEWIKNNIIEADCLTDYYGSDHGPILLTLQL